jgi:flagellar assembly protein FliH
MNKVIRTARISSEPVILPIHIDRGLVELAFEATTEAFTEAEFESAQVQDVEASAGFTPLGEQAELVDVEDVTPAAEAQEPQLSMEEVEALVQERLGEAEARFLQEKEQEKEAAHQAGFEAGQAQGYAEGHAAGLAEGQAQSQDEIVRFQSMLNHIADRWDHVFKSADLDVTQLAFAVAKNIVGSVVDAHDDLVLQSVRDCLKYVQDTTQLTIYVHPEDLALVRGNRSHWQEAYERIESLNIEADESIEKGGCLIETPSGDIDAQISSRLEKLQVAILERLQGAPQEVAPDVSDVIAEDDVQGADGEMDIQDDPGVTDLQADGEIEGEDQIQALEDQAETLGDMENDLDEVFLPEDVVEAIDTQIDDETAVEDEAQNLEAALETTEEMIDDLPEAPVAGLEGDVQNELDVEEQQAEEGSDNVNDSVDETPESEDDEAGQL